MKLIVGLGNPGREYEKTRHNLGFLVLDGFLKNLGEKANGNEKFIFEKKLKSHIACVNDEGQKIILAKPQTFMNLSGIAVNKIISFHKLDSKGLLVVHDDLDLPLGKFRFSRDSGPAGHNGVISIIRQLGTKKFNRLRIGIKIDSPFLELHEEKPKFVVQKFSPEELETVHKMTPVIEEAILYFINFGFEKTAEKYN